MKSEKVKEIKKALEFQRDSLAYLKDNVVEYVSCKDILTLINELESENERLKEENGYLSCDLDLLNEKLTNAEIEVSDYQDKIIELNSEIAELEKENENLKKQLIAIDALDENNFEKRHNAIVFITEKQLKQFAEMLKEEAENYYIADFDGHYHYEPFIEQKDFLRIIDKKLKEFLKGDLL